MDGPHILGFSPLALCMSFMSVLASARLPTSSIANVETLTSVGLVLFSATIFLRPFKISLASAWPPSTSRIVSAGCIILANSRMSIFGVTL